MLTFILANKKLIILLVMAAAIFGSGWKAHAWKTDSSMLAMIEKQQKTYEEKLEAKEEIIRVVTAKKQKTKVIYREIRNEIRNTELGTCNLTDEFKQLWNQAAMAGATTAVAYQPDGPLP